MSLEVWYLNNWDRGFYFKKTIFFAFLFWPIYQAKSYTKTEGCENCKINQAIDVHHLVFQNEADENGVIKKKGLIFDNLA